MAQTLSCWGCAARTMHTVASSWGSPHSRGSDSVWAGSRSRRACRTAADGASVRLPPIHAERESPVRSDDTGCRSGCSQRGGANAPARSCASRGRGCRTSSAALESSCPSHLPQRTCAAIIAHEPLPHSTISWGSSRQFRESHNYIEVISIIADENRIPDKAEFWEAFQSKLYVVATL